MSRKITVGRVFKARVGKRYEKVKTMSRAGKTGWNCKRLTAESGGTLVIDAKNLKPLPRITRKANSRNTSSVSRNKVMNVWNTLAGKVYRWIKTIELAKPKA